MECFLFYTCFRVISFLYAISHGSRPYIVLYNINQIWSHRIGLLGSINCTDYCTGKRPHIIRICHAYTKQKHLLCQLYFSGHIFPCNLFSLNTFIRCYRHWVTHIVEHIWTANDIKKIKWNSFRNMFPLSSFSN